MLSQRLGFSFKEEDLSPKLRREIGFIAKKLRQYDQTIILRDKSKSAATNLIAAIVLLTILGVIFLFVYLIGTIFLVLAYVVYRSYKKKKNLAATKESEATSLQSEINNQVKELSESTYSELSLLHEAKVRPTVKHIMVDFADIIEAAKGKGIFLSTIECPYCKAAIEIPTTGEYFKCKYCGKTIYAIKVLDKLKGILSPN